MPRELFEFGPFVLDCSRGMLLRAGSRVVLGRRSLALLQALLEADGQVVSKSELMDAAWPNTSIDESNLTVQIAALRRCLGASPSGEELIATVPRVGYRFVQPLNQAEAARKPVEAVAPKPSVAVLAFTNLSSDLEQEYFADGLAEDLITDLSKVPGLTVIARHSSFSYRGRQVDIGTIAKDLGVQYIVEGSVRRAATRVRINAQLIDATDNSHIWADRFDRDLADIFALQDEVVSRIVRALADVLPSGRPSRIQRPANLKAYDLFVRGRSQAMLSPESIRSGRPLLEKSIELDPSFAEAHAWLAMNHHFGWKFWGEAVEPHRSKSRTIAEQAVLLDPGSADAHWILGYIRAYDGELAEGEAEFDVGLRFNPNQADAWALFTDVKVLEGNALEAIDCSRNGFRLNPYPPEIYYACLGWAQYAAGQYEEAVKTLQQEATHRTGSQRILAASLAQLGRMEEARKEAQEFLAMVPDFTVRHWAATRPFRREADRQHFVEGYINAGLPP